MFRASWRDTLLLLSEFRSALLVFLFAILGGGVLYYLIAEKVGEPLQNFSEAIYVVLSLAFFQPPGEFPESPYLEAFFFVMPLIGIGSLALGLADFGYLFFNRRARSKEWEMAIASTLDKHHILVGLGHLGFHVVQHLKGAMNRPMAVIELNPTADLVQAVQEMDIPIIHDDASRESALEAAGVRRASSIILCIQDDAVNLKIALKARSMNPGIRVIIRIFDDDFAQALTQQFGFIALSGTGLAAPAFAASATDSEITPPISIEGESLSLARITVSPGCLLEGKTVGQIEDGYVVSVILVRHDSKSGFHPTDSHPIKTNDMVAVLGRPDRLHQLIHDSQ
ncbi:MAG: NAD-binding protein [Anaerolineales bacterium]|nr:NAD-binding protein [Anaerolineales bacterium]